MGGSERLDVGVAELYPSPAPLWHSTWQVAALFGINDSSLRALVERGAFPGAMKNHENEWIIPGKAVAERLLHLDSEAEKRRSKVLTPHVPAERRTPNTYVVYRWFDKDDVLLYVGLSSCAPRRAKQHSKEKEWWELQVDMKSVHYPTREEAAAAEMLAIATENPLYNKQGKKVQK